MTRAPCAPPPQDAAAADDAVWAAHVEHVLDAGVDGLVPCGTTGEASTLSREEKRQVIRRVVDVAGGQCPVIAGVGTNSTSDTITFAGDALDAGADALLVVTPYYNKPPQEGLYAHFMAVVEAHDAPVILYDVPGRTAVHMCHTFVSRSTG